MSYRDRLYANYSSNFGAQKEFQPELQFSVYEQVYKNLPTDLETPMVDLGCGKGEWLAWLQAKGYTNLSGIDVAASEVEFTEDSSIRMITGDVTSCLLEQRESFGILHAKDVLEHLTKDEIVEFFDACLQALEPGGQLWILTFNAQSPLSSATRYGDFTHETGVTPTSLAQALRATGFEVAGVHGFQAHSGSMSGRGRGFLFGIAEKAASLLLKLRHGNNASDPSVDTYSAMPDLFAMARKPDDSGL